MKTPVVLIIFRRPFQTQRVFDEIARYEPERLFVVADGPRTDDEVAQCDAARAIIKQVDWECQVLTNYSDTNLGCKVRISSGLDWVFSRSEEAIILEDDCVPHPSFFPYCAELLERYRDDERVMVISGDNHQFGRNRTPYSYYFSRYPHCWGWASWRRAWRHFDGSMSLWPAVRDTSWLLEIMGDDESAAYWRAIFDRVCAGHVDSWAYPWTFSCWLQNGLCILPNDNLVSNIGFGEGATHTHDARHPWANTLATAVAFPLRHPPAMMRNREADLATFRHEYSPAPPSLYRRVRRKLTSRVPGPTRAHVRHLRSRWHAFRGAS